MPAPAASNPLAKSRLVVARRVRELRRGRRWTQEQLAGELGISQGRLSELERGDGSFTAEQLLRVLRLFNVSISEFDVAPVDSAAELQNALARLGARHLRERSDVIVSERLATPPEAVREALVTGAPRLLTALAPVLVSHLDRIPLRRLHAQLVDAGLEHRLAWLVENTLEAVRHELAQPLPGDWARRYRRAELVLGNFLDVATTVDARHPPPRNLDILDVEIRGERTLADVTSRRSPISQRWGIVTRLLPSDFTLALEAARAVR